jgi:hypothetical protein
MILTDHGFFFGQQIQKIILKGGENMNRGPNIKLKTFLLKEGITQRQLSFGIEIDESQISKAVKHNITTAEIRERVADFLNLNQSDIFDQRNY